MRIFIMSLNYTILIWISIEVPLHLYLYRKMKSIWSNLIQITDRQDLISVRKQRDSHCDQDRSSGMFFQGFNQWWLAKDQWQPLRILHYGWNTRITDILWLVEINLIHDLLGSLRCQFFRLIHKLHHSHFQFFDCNHPISFRVNPMEATDCRLFVVDIDHKIYHKYQYS